MNSAREIAEELRVPLMRNRRAVFLNQHQAVSVVRRASGSQPADAFPALLGQRRTAHSPGHAPGRDARLRPRIFDDLLSELAQADAGAGQVLASTADQAEHVALGGSRVHAQQKVRRAQMEEAQRVAIA
jgi:hypothetical protein